MIDISSFKPPWFRDQLLPVFKQSGFANQSLGKYKLLPCSLGWFVNASSEANECIECPAGKVLLSLADNTSLNFFGGLIENQVSGHKSISVV